MNKEEYSGQDEQIISIIGKIKEIVKDQLNTIEIGTMIRKVIQMRENAENESAIRNYISSVTKIDQNNDQLDAILAEIEEKPFQNNYFPFQNSILDQLKKDLEKE